MKRREFLVGAAATAVAAIVATPALPAILKPVDPEDYNVKYSDVVFEAMNRTHGTPKSELTDARVFAIRGIMNRHWLDAKEQGKNLHLYVDFGRFHDFEVKRPIYAYYMSDKISLIQRDGSYKLVKDRTKVIEHAQT